MDFFETSRTEPATNPQKATENFNRKELNNKGNRKMKTNCYLKPAWTHNGSVRTDLPLTVVAKAAKREIAETLRPGQLFCVGKVYIKTHNGTIRIK